MKYFIKALRNYTNFKDRATRAEYWFFILTAAMIMVSLFFVNLLLVGHNNSLAGVSLGFTYIFVVLMVIPEFALIIRRLHDLNRPAPWILVAAVPVIGWVLFLGLMAMDGTKGDNDYGPDPKNRIPPIVKADGGN